MKAIKTVQKKNTKNKPKKRAKVNTVKNKIANNQRLFIKLHTDYLGNVSKVCQEMGISRTTFYGWYNDYEDFRNKIDENKEYILDTVENILLKKINEGDTTCLIFFLKTQGQRRGYIEKRQIEHSGGVQTQPTEFIFIEAKDAEKNKRK